MNKFLQEFHNRGYFYQCTDETKLEKILNNQIAYYNGMIAKHAQNVEIYLNQPVGIGEHSDVMGTIDGEINAIAQAHEKIEIINHYFLNR